MSKSISNPLLGGTPYHEASLHDVDDVPPTAYATDPEDNSPNKGLAAGRFGGATDTAFAYAIARDAWEIETMRRLSLYADRNYFKHSMASGHLIHGDDLSRDLVWRRSGRCRQPLLLMSPQHDAYNAGYRFISWAPPHPGREPRLHFSRTPTTPAELLRQKALIVKAHKIDRLYREAFITILAWNAAIQSPGLSQTPVAPPSAVRCDCCRKSLASVEEWWEHYCRVMRIPGDLPKRQLPEKASRKVKEGEDREVAK